MKELIRMKAYLILSGSGPMVVLTSYGSIENPALLEKLASKGIRKFIAAEVPVDLARERYDRQFKEVVQDLHQADDLRVLDYNGQRAMDMFSFSEMGNFIFHDPNWERIPAKASGPLLVLEVEEIFWRP